MPIMNRPRVFPCRHCRAKNRLRPLEAVRSLDRVKCGHCTGKLFYEAGEQFTALSPRAYEHPLDRQALAALQRIPGVDSILKFILRECSERSYKMLFMQTAVRVHERHLRPLHNHIVYAAKVLDLSPIPQLYVLQDPRPNAFAVGVQEPCVGVTTRLLEILDERQILGVIGHELGHIQAGHQLYRTALGLIIHLALGLLGRVFPITSTALFAIQQALLYWYRCAELTCDRAQMLVQRDFDSFVQCEMKFAGGSTYTNGLLNPEQFLVQAEEATHMQEENVLNRMFSLLQESSTTHPFPVWRAGHMHTWVVDGEYLDILSGQYETRHGPDEPLQLEESVHTATPDVIKRFLDDMRGFLGR